MPTMRSTLRRLLPALLFFPLAAHGTLVTTKTDEDNGSLGGGTGISLREAVKYSPAGDTITFAPALSGQTIRLTLGEITIANSLTIDGSALPVKITLSGDKTGNGKTFDDTRVLKITTGTVLLESLVLTRGYRNTGPNGYGGAIHVESTTTRLTIRNSTLSDNQGATYGGAIYFQGALNSPESFLTLQNCILTGNYTGHDGGAIRTFGTLRVENTRFSGNSSNQGCAIYHRDGSATVENSTFTSNTAVGGGYGGGIWNYGNFIIRSSTFSGNTATDGGGIYNISGALTVENSTLTANTGNAIQVAGGTVSVRHATIVGNSGSIGGGIYRTAGTLSVNQSIVSGNTGSPPLNISGSYTGSGNLTAVSPLLAPLGNYGGPTQTMPPLPGSPAINAGGSAKLLTDQRGLPRDAMPDIGAVEYQSADFLTLMPHFWALDADGDGLPYAIERLHGTDPAVPDAASPRLLSAPVRDGQGRAILKFDVVTTAPDLPTRPRWSLKRSADLSPGSFQEIYHYGFDGSYAFTHTGASYTHELVGNIDRITVIDANPPPGGAFYRFEAVFAP